MTIDIVEGSMPLSCARGRMEVSEVEGGTEVVFTMRYEPRYGIAGRMMDLMMMRRSFRAPASVRTGSMTSGAAGT